MRLRTRLLTLLVAASAAAGVAPSPAAAGTYTVHSCRTPDGAIAPTDGWIRGGDFAQEDFCADTRFRFLALNAGNNTGARASQGAVYGFVAPDDTTIAGYTLWRSSQVSPKTSGPESWATVIFEVDREIDFNRNVDLCNGSQGCRGRGFIDRPLDPANRVDRPQMPATTRSVRVVAGCSQADCQPDSPQANFQIHRSDFRLDDRTPPRFSSAPAGTLATPNAVLTGPGSVSYAATDAGGGLRTAELRVDGNVVDSQPVDDNLGRCREPYTHRVPCKLSAGGTLSFDPTRLPDGQHSVRVTIVDAGGNDTTSAPVQIFSRNPTLACGPDAPGPRIEASLPGGKRGRRGRGGGATAVTGGLLDPAGAPIANAPLRLVSRDDRQGATPAGRDDITTGPDGAFVVPIGPGPSRAVRIGYRFGAEGALRCSRRLTVAVPARVSLKLSRRKVNAPGSVRIRGRLTLGPVPKGGKLVDLQAYDRKKWRTFDTARASESGRFTARLRFGRRARPGSYPIRARVRREALYPYALGYSKSTRVRVR